MVPGLSKWKIDQARLHTTQVGAGMSAEEKTIHGTRLQPAQTDHFLDFISQPAYLQDVAFGIRTLKLEDGSKIVIPAAIRTVIPSRIISQYTSYCKERGFVPASKRRCVPLQPKIHYRGSTILQLRAWRHLLYWLTSSTP